MFGSGYWYVGPAADGRRFCWAKAPSFECPVQRAAHSFHQGVTLAEAPPLVEAIFDAASALGTEPKWLARQIGRLHDRARKDGKLTDRCECGARMDRLGFAYWTERPTEHEGKGSPTALARLGLSEVQRLSETRYADTKREAEQWAREELKIARRAEAEAS